MKGLTKKELQEYVYIKAELERLDREREYWYAAAEKCTRDSKTERVCGAGHDSLPYIVDKLSELANITADAYDRLAALRKHIEDAVMTLTGVERLIIRERYLEGKCWERLTVDLGYSPESRPWLYQMHSRALKKLTTENNTIPVL